MKYIAYRVSFDIQLHSFHITIEFCDIKCVEIQIRPGDFPAAHHHHHQKYEMQGHLTSSLAMAIS